MNFQFDLFDQIEKPTLILCNPNKEELFSMGAAYNILPKIKFNALSELVFDVPAQTNNGEFVNYYDYLQAKRLVFIENIGYFIIITVDEDLKGITNIKTVTCNSLEAELIYKKITAFTGTFQFYDPISPQGTLLGYIASLVPTWTVGFIDGALLSTFRTFDINDKTIYDFLMNEVSTAYQCVFVFDTFGKTISAYLTTNATTDTDIFLSFDNLLKSGKFSELTDELVTALHVYGEGDLDIHLVNPLGTSVIYNFDFFKNLNWMSQGLIDLLNIWENNVITQQSGYATLLTELSTANDGLINLQGQLDDANSQRSALVLVQRDRIQAGLPYGDINSQITTLDTLISSLKHLISLQNGTIKSFTHKLNNISQRLSFDFAFSPSKQSTLLSLYSQLEDANGQMDSFQSQLSDLNHQINDLSDLITYNIQQGLSHASQDAQMLVLTSQLNSLNSKILAQQVIIDGIQNNIDSVTQNNISSQLLELNTFIIENTYQNNNFIITDIMTASDRQDEAQQLYNQAQIVLQKVSQPRYEASIDSANFIFIKDFKPFTDQLEMGCVVTVQKDGGSGDLLKLVLLELDFQYDDPTKFTITISNRVRLDKSGFTYSDLFNQAVNAGTSVNFNSTAWSDWTNNSKDTVTAFIDSALNAANNNIVSSNNQEIIIDQSGLRGRQLNSSNQTYNGDQVWLVNDMLAFTANAWGSSQLALGRITVNGTSTFGLVADTIVGRILAGNQLTITNQNNTFILDGNGATLTNANFTLTGNSGKNKIILNPTNGIKIQSLVNSQFVDKFFVDSSGNINFAGILSGASGSFSGSITATTGLIGGWTINSIGLSSPTNGNFINSNGNLKLGPLSITGNTGTFNGSFNASQLSGQIVGSQIAAKTISDYNIDYLSADKIIVGTLTGIDIFGTVISWPGVTMYQPGNYGWSEIDCGKLSIVSSGLGHGSGGIDLDGDHISLAAQTTTTGDLEITGTLWAGHYGLSTVLNVSTPNGPINLFFSKGILYDLG